MNLINRITRRLMHSEARMRPVVKNNISQAMAGAREAKLTTVAPTKTNRVRESFTPIWKAFDTETIEKIRKPSKEEINSPDDSKVLRAAIIGLRSSGKSSLLNNITGAHVSAVSKRAYSTRRWTMGIHTIKKTQLILLDTPSIRVSYSVNHKFSTTDKTTEKDLLVSEAAWDATVHSDVIIVAVPCYLPHLVNEQQILLQTLKDKLEQQGTPDKPVYFAITMADRSDLASNVKPLIKDLQQLSPLEVRGMSVVGRQKVHSYATFCSMLLKEALPSPWSFPKEFKTNQTKFEIVENLALEAILTEVYSNPEYFFVIARVVGWTLGYVSPNGRQQLTINILYTFGFPVVAGLCRDKLSYFTTLCRRKFSNTLPTYDITVKISINEAPLSNWQWENPYGHYKPNYISPSMEETISQVFNPPETETEESQ